MKNTPHNCDHLRVAIRRIVRAYARKIGRVIGGKCDNCGGEVERTQTERELRTGKQETHWTAA